MKSALVLDGELKSSLAIVRSLGRGGVWITSGSGRGSAMALASRYTKRPFVYRSPLKDPEGFLADIVAAAKLCSEPPLVFASSDATMLLISRNRDRLGEFMKLFLPSIQSVEVAASKKDTAALATELARESVPVAMPPAYGARSLEDIQKLDIPYPAVIKPQHTAVWRDTGTFDTATIVSSHEELVQEAQRVMLDSGEVPLVQKFLQGGEYGVEVLAHEGRVLAWAGHKRIRSLSPRGGASVVKVSIEPTQAMRAVTQALMQKLLWSGVAMVEFKEDASTGTLYLLEINGRFWGSLALAIYSGVDFPILYDEVARGQTPRAGAFRAGVSSRHFWGDVQWLLRVWFARDSLRPVLYPGRLRALVQFLTPGHKPDVWSRSDPLPAFAELRDIIARKFTYIC